MLSYVYFNCNFELISARISCYLFESGRICLKNVEEGMFIIFYLIFEAPDRMYETLYLNKLEHLMVC